MKKKIKKNRLKIFIALSLMITCLFGVMFATNTFAYETDTFSYTINELELNSSYNSWTYDSNTHTFYSPYNTNGYFSFYAYLKTNNNTTGKKAFLMNYNIYRSSNNTDWYLWQQQNANAVVSVYNTTTSTNNLICKGQTKQNTYNYNNMYTIYASPYSNNNNSIETYNNQNRVLVYGEYFSNGSTNQYIKVEILNIDFVSVEDVSLNQYYDTYIANIEENYNQLLENYEDLETDYMQLSNDYNTLESNYNTLENNYNTLDTTYSQMNEYYAYGALSYLKELEVYDGSNSAQYTFEDLKINANYLVGGSNVNLSYIMFDSDTELGYADFEFYDNLYLPLIQFTLSSVGVYPNDFLLSIYRNNQYYTTIHINTINFDNANYITYDYLLENYDNSLLSTDTLKYISLGGVGSYEANRTTVIFTTQDMIMYQNGYNNASYYYNQKITELTNNYNNQIQDLNDRVSNLELVIETKNEQIASYARSSYGLNNLMWTIGSVPFESFKQIWNVEFLGVDIANFILGIITTFIGLYIVKKFFL